MKDADRSAGDFPPLREQQALFGEWTQDYAEAKDRDGKAAFGAILNGVSAPSPQSGIDNQRDREDGIGR
ncbi:hypothetical protein [Frigoriglobus tundricola]|uniref:Uncharacterized protein n=1 Tax=Frigoriglobus tundricola TaxID=2774151 RepID=A0A6M5YJF8_9BACT|nr:hypothetical protein [Frigoriglobus tundricola]QJW94197.1 hypothetical protein FTUN_1716 [Frigoriglobus tundricola]